MSLENPVIDFIDGETRQIFLKQGVTEWNPIDDIYVEVKQLRQEVANLRKFDMFVDPLPLFDLGQGQTTGRALVMLEAQSTEIVTTIVPFDEAITQTVTGLLISTVGLSGTDLIDVSTATNPLVIEYQPPPATEVVTVNVGGETVQMAVPMGRGANCCTRTVGVSPQRLTSSVRKIINRVYINRKVDVEVASLNRTVQVGRTLTVKAS